MYVYLINTICSVVPQPRPKEYIIPLIKTNNWRVPEGGVADQILQATLTDDSSDVTIEMKLTTPTTDKDITQLATEAILEGNIN